MPKFLEGFTPYEKDDAERYNRLRWWPGITLSDLLDKAEEAYPEKEAFVDGRSRLTYSQAKEKVNRLAVGLVELGVKPLDRVLLQLPNWNEFVYTYFSLQKIGAIVVLLIERYRQYEINHLIKLTGANTWIVAEKYKKMDYLPLIRDVLNNNTQLRRIILVRGKKTEGYSNLEELIENARLTKENHEELFRMRPDPMQVAHMGPTGGTTGLPKVVPHTHNTLICNNKHVGEAWDLGPEDICLLAGPIGHDLTFTKGLLSCLCSHANIIFLDSLDMEDVCQKIEQEKVTSIVWVPTLASRLVHYEKLKDHNLSSLKKMHCGGGASLPDLIKTIRKELGCNYFNAYGGTEGQSTITRPDDDMETVYSTVGRPTCPHDIYKIVDQVGDDLPPNTPGELLIKGPGVFTGYYNNPEENAKVFDKDGFFKTGDIAMIDKKGYVTLTGRVKEMINRAGESISATEIERLIIDHPEVISIAVIPMPDLEMGERVCAYIQPRPGADLNFEKIISFLKEKKASVLQFPERIEFIETMPFTKAEKVDKSFLREDIKRKLNDTQ
ncbi:AMP-binding protein [Thermodesulfobacteriota bacterium]